MWKPLVLVLGLFFSSCGLWTQGPDVPVVEVAVEGRVLAVGVCEVSQQLYRVVTGETPSLAHGADLPVDSVSWYDAVAFCNRLSALNGLEQAYGKDGPDSTKTGWRLPTEKEWKALAVADPGSAAGSWYVNNSEQHTHATRTRAPNSLGLYDVFGNVWEWCDSDVPGGRPVDHGGGFRTSGALLIPTTRGVQGQGSRADDLGFRVVRTLGSASSPKP